MRLASRVHADIDETLSWRHLRELEIRLSEGEAECQAKERQPQSESRVDVHPRKNASLSADVSSNKKPAASKRIPAPVLLL